ncbi:MAG: response regulator [Gemmatimonadota bacterium]
MRPRVTVIEDNPDNRLLVEVLLENTYELTLFENGKAALEGMAEAAPDVVLLDISLPGMDGPEVLTRMRQMPELAAVPVVALTAHAMAGDRERYLEMGFDAYVSKPITDEKRLLSTIEDLLRRGSSATA